MRPISERQCEFSPRKGKDYIALEPMHHRMAQERLAEEQSSPQFLGSAKSKKRASTEAPVQLEETRCVSCVVFPYWLVWCDVKRAYG